MLHGTPVSAGIVTAKARVVLDPEAESGLQPGEILVAPVTDAGWTPLFALAGGLVVDLGSALSHGSTVAREYGLPAVVNVHNGTRAIKTGDLVTVNGSAGTVSIAAPDEAEG
ncbi:MAG: PEP-utilizing enzyme [Dehalococcoidia bacterium]|nr:PEP-utilizing enzyme [Dehalococcoidia bacterium]